MVEEQRKLYSQSKWIVDRSHYCLTELKQRNNVTALKISAIAIWFRPRSEGAKVSTPQSKINIRTVFFLKNTIILEIYVRALMFSS